MGRLEQQRQDKLNEPTKEAFLSYVLILFESPFASVFTVSRGHTPLVSLYKTDPILRWNGGGVLDTRWKSFLKRYMQCDQ